jgi:hypothetical protein
MSPWSRNHNRYDDEVGQCERRSIRAARIMKTQGEREAAICEALDK